MRDSVKEKILCTLISSNYALLRERTKLEADTIQFIKEGKTSMEDLASLWEPLLYKASMRYISSKKYEEKILLGKWFPKKNRDDMARNIIRMIVNSQSKS